MLILRESHPVVVALIARVTWAFAQYAHDLSVWGFEFGKENARAGTEQRGSCRNFNCRLGGERLV